MDFELPTDDFNPAELRRPARNPNQRNNFPNPLEALEHTTADTGAMPNDPYQAVSPDTPRRRIRKTQSTTPTPPEAPVNQQSAPVSQPTKVVPSSGSNATATILSAWNWLKDVRIQIFIGVLIILSATYVLVANISYMATSEADQSILLSSTFGHSQAHPLMITNTTGWLGAKIAHLLFYRWLGIGSFAIIYYAFAIGITLVGLHRFHFWKLTFSCCVTAMATSLITGLISFHSVTPTYWGGEYGYYINAYLLEYASVWGALAVSIASLTAIVLTFLKPIGHVCRNIKSICVDMRHAMAQRHVEASEAAAQNARHSTTPTPEPTGYEPEASAFEPTNRATSLKVDDTSIWDSAQTLTTPESTEEPIPELAVTTTSATNDLTDIDQVTFTPTTPPEHRATLAGLSSTPDPASAPIPTLSLRVDHSAQATHLEPEDILPDVPMTILTPTATEENSQLHPEAESASVESHTHKTPEEILSGDLYDPRADLSHFHLPTLDILDLVENTGPNTDQEEQEANKQRITRTLRSYGVEIKSITATIGPTVTLYEIVPADGVRVGKIKRLGDDMTLSLSAIGIRIIAPIPGKGTIGMEVPNKRPQIVSIREILGSKAFAETKAALPMAMGKTIQNEVYISDLAKMPHLLVAGATGMGKSVGLNTIIASLLYKKHPAEVKFVLVDPKMVEFSLYKVLERHYLAKLPDEESAIITDPTKVVATLNSLCVEMDSRYELLSQAGMRGIKEYNQKFMERRLNPEKGHRYLPYIVVIIDEFADLILTAGKEVEAPISRIAAKARAVGIHMILATQRPSVNVITGVIKANFPGRIAFRVTQRNDSQTILDRPGAEQLIGRGDMIISRDGIIERVQCAFIDTPEVERICNEISAQQGYACAYELPDFMPATDGNNVSGGVLGERDPLFAEAAREVLASGIGSTSALQRKFNIGYPRAGKIMDQLEIAGVVGPTTGGKPRAVLMDPYTFEQMLKQQQ